MKNQIAIVGIGCRYPEFVNTPTKLWDFLQNIGDGIRQVPESRWDLDKYYDPNPDAPGKMYADKASFLHDDIFAFDPQFFGMSPREAQTLDPQQRLLLETTFEAFQDAGIPLSGLQRRQVGVFVGGFMMDNQFLRVSEQGLPHINNHTPVSGSLTLLSNRISHAFDFTGPSISIDTACSSSLVAIHLACESLISGNSELAIAGGVNVMLGPQASIMMCKGKFLAKDGRSKAFFNDADGYGRGEGAGMIVLKSLEAAERDGDSIYAVIEATAVNQDGHTEGIALPNQESQIAVIREAVAKAQIDPSEVDYVEAHGTGTQAGDPLELGALGTVYGQNRTQPLAVGSVKINLGHTEAAAGVTGLIKAALTLKNGRILPHMNRGKLNEDIPFEALNINIPLSGNDWYQSIQPRLAAVNSFGYGGTNAHAILSAYQQEEKTQAPVKQEATIFQLSARSKEALQQHANMMLGWLQEQPEVSMPALAQTLNHKRDKFEYLQLFRASSQKELSDRLEKFGEEKLFSPSPQSSEKLVWVFTGMGPQWWGMGQQLYQKEAVFKAKLDECDRLFRAISGYSILEEMMKEEASSRITQNHLAQAANFYIQIGLSALLQDWGMKPDAIVGHSVGEVAAAVVAGVMDLPAGIRLIYHRGRILEKIAGKGTLMAIGLGYEDAVDFLKNHPAIEIATINSPRSVALAGTSEALAEVEAALTAKNIFAKFVRVEVAYHSSQADELEEAFQTAFAFAQPQQPTIPLYSTLLARQVKEAVQDGNYWWKNVRECVHFYPTIDQILEDGYINFMEIGPHPVLGSSISEIMKHKELQGNTFHSLRRKGDEVACLLQNMSRTIQAGVEIELPAFPDAVPLDLPRYAWDKDIYWEEAEGLQRLRKGENERHPFLQEKIPFSSNHWKSSIHRPALHFLKDHQVGENIVFPGAGYIECMLATARNQSAAFPLIVEHLRFEKPFIFTENQFPQLHCQLHGQQVQIESAWEDNRSPHMQGRIVEKGYYQLPAFDRQAAFDQLDPIGHAYEELAQLGLNYGPAFQAMKAIQLNGKEVFAKMEIAADEKNEFLFHPSLMDGAFQSLLVAAMAYHEQQAFLPVEIGSLRLYAPAGQTVFSYGKITQMDKTQLTADLILLNEEREVIAELKGLVCKKAIIQQGANPAREWIYKYTWSDMQLSKASKSTDHQVFDLRKMEQGDLYQSGLQASQQVLQLLQNPALISANSRLILIVQHALIDEMCFPTQEVNPAHAPIVGLARVAMTELPQLQIQLIDIDESEASEAMLRQLLNSDFEAEEVIIREGKLYAGSLERAQPGFVERIAYTRIQAAHQPKRLDMLRPGKLESLVLRDYQPAALQGDAVRIRVSHSSINFKDVMKAMGMLNDAALENTFAGKEFGLEGTGTVEAVAEGVQHLQVGDKVYFMAAGLKTHITVSEQVCVKMPEGLSLESMASIFVYITAYAGLVKMAHLKAGEKVLIHSAAGGVGLSACHIARMLGAEVHATAGTEEKRQFLRELGIDYVYDSRSLNFADEVLENTGNGVDVVLNSLAGEPLKKSLELVKTLGRFVELGKQDITRHNSLDLSPFNKSIQFIALDLDKITPLRPDFMCEMVNELFQHFLAGELPMLPYQVLKANQLEDAFRKLASGSLIGKVVVDFELEEIESVPELEKDFTFAQNEAAIITGGCSGYGLKSALYLADWGLKNLVLCSRRGKVSDAERAVVAKLERKGVQIMEMAMDVMDSSSIEAVLEKIAEKGLQLAGILHAATVLHDRVIDQISKVDFEKGYAPKALGAWNLHLATQQHALKFFICYSSIVSYTGNPGQLTYAAANSFLDGLMAYRHRLGLKGSSISWGAIAEVGILTRNVHADAHLKSVGVAPINPDKSLSMMKELVLNGHAHAAVAQVDWNRWVMATPGSWRRLSSLVQESAHGKDMPEAVMAILEQPEEQQLEAVKDAVKRILVNTTGARQETITDESMLANFGMDSIMAVELTVEFQTMLGIELSVMEILGSGSVLQLAQNCLKKLLGMFGEEDGERVSERVGVGERERNLISYYLERITVARPYFDLKSISKVAEGLEATVEPVLIQGDIGLWTSESARHMAILGSCAAVDANPEAGKFCYPVKLAKVRASRALSSEIPEQEYRITAQISSFDKRNAHCTAETRLLNSQGECIIEMSVTYHIIPVEGLHEMFKTHKLTSPEWQDKSKNPYQDMSLDALVFEGDELAVLPMLKAEHCVGHFDNLPAFPVSIMTRYAGQLLERRLGKGSHEFIHGCCETFRFIFAGERVAFKLAYSGQEDSREKWICEMYAEGEIAAKFSYFLEPNPQAKEMHAVQHTAALK